MVVNQNHSVIFMLGNFFVHALVHCFIFLLGPHLQLSSYNPYLHLATPAALQDMPFGLGDLPVNLALAFTSIYVGES